MAAYQAAIAGKEPSVPAKAANANGTLAWLIDRWKESANWENAAPATRRQRENILKHVIENAGTEPFVRIRTKHIMNGMAKRKDTPFAANNFLKTMKALFKWAVAADYIEQNPAQNVEMMSKATDGFPPWSLADVERYRARWALGTRQRLAFEVLFNTGLRRGDAVRMGRQHVKDGVASLKAEKTGTDLFVPITPTLLEAIDAGPTGDLAFIAGENGRPLSKESFGNYFREWCAEAGAEGSAHGLRKLRASMMADSGASEKELQAAFGWTSAGMSQIYTRAADRKRLALQAAKRLDIEHPMLSPIGKVRARVKKS